MDTQLAACLTAGDEDRRSVTLEALCRRLQSQTPFIPLCFKRTSVLLPYDAVDTITPTAADPFYCLENWQVNWDTADTNTDTKTETVKPSQFLFYSQYVRITALTLPRMEALRPSMGLYASFSGISHTWPSLRFRRFTVASSPISATMISPLWASCC